MDRVEVLPELGERVAQAAQRVRPLFLLAGRRSVRRGVRRRAPGAGVLAGACALPGARLAVRLGIGRFCGVFAGVRTGHALGASGVLLPARGARVVAGGVLCGRLGRVVKRVGRTLPLRCGAPPRRGAGLLLGLLARLLGLGILGILPALVRTRLLMVRLAVARDLLVRLLGILAVVLALLIVPHQLLVLLVLFAFGHLALFLAALGRIAVERHGFFARGLLALGLGFRPVLGLALWLTLPLCLVHLLLVLVELFLLVLLPVVLPLLLVQLKLVLLLGLLVERPAHALLLLYLFQLGLGLGLRLGLGLSLAFGLVLALGCLVAALAGLLAVLSRLGVGAFALALGLVLAGPHLLVDRARVERVDVADLVLHLLLLLLFPVLAVFGALLVGALRLAFDVFCLARLVGLGGVLVLLALLLVLLELLHLLVVLERVAHVLGALALAEARAALQLLAALFGLFARLGLLLGRRAEPARGQVVEDHTHHECEARHAPVRERERLDVRVEQLRVQLQERRQLARRALERRGRRWPAERAL